MGGWWIADFWNSPQLGPVFVVSWLVWVIVSIVLHELAHGWAALRMGDPTPRVTGHMTWNPLVHMGGFSLVALALIGIAWGAMPVDPSRMRGRHADAIVSAAGPAMNLLLAAVALIALVIWAPLASGELISSVTIAEPLRGNLETFLRVGAMLNLVLLMFNLLPAMPLDGGRIAAHYIRPYREFVMSEHGMWISMGLMLVFFWFAGDFIFPAALSIVRTVTDLLWMLMGVSP
jgi:Zn-dependent protease